MQIFTCRDAYLDDLDADLLLSGSDGFKPAADNRWDERCSIKQVKSIQNLIFGAIVILGV